jgi:geranylgeranyl diphosphate synthase, type II
VIELPPESDVSVADVLDRYGTVTRSAMQSWLPQGEPREYLYNLVADYPSRGGRMFRPSICVAAGRVFGATVEQLLPAAVCIELIHNALLIHDDIEDESEERRGKPTLHHMVGTALALNAGDSLAFLSLRPILQARNLLGPSIVLRILEEFDQMAQHTAEGQALDLGWRQDNRVDLCEEDYLEMVLKKTCWLTTLFPLRIGALIGSRDSVDLDSFFRFGFFLGAAFQIQDDVLNLVGNHDQYGKEMAGDLHEGKRTLMLVRLLEVSSDSDRDRVEAILATPRDEREQGAVQWLRSEMVKKGCIDYARELAHGLAGAASYEFDQVFSHFSDSRDKQFLSRLPNWVIERS